MKHILLFPPGSDTATTCKQKYKLSDCFKDIFVLIFAFLVSLEIVLYIIWQYVSNIRRRGISLGRIHALQRVASPFLRRLDPFTEEVCPGAPLLSGHRPLMSRDTLLSTDRSPVSAVSTGDKECCFIRQWEERQLLTHRVIRVRNYPSGQTWISREGNAVSAVTKLWTWNNWTWRVRRNLKSE